MSVPPAGLHPLFTVSFGGGTPEAFTSLQVGLPVLGGKAIEQVFSRAESIESEHGFSLFRQADWLLGQASLQAGRQPGNQTFEIYHNLLEATRGHRLCRIWNYVPRINEALDASIEVYRDFSLGRSRAFEARFGAGFNEKLPAASAVGSDGDELTVIFAAHTAEPRHLENPLQVPAYRYPPEHGPRPPSFARATVVPRKDGRRDVFISGTSAIRGHRTVAPGQIVPQLECTVENIEVIAEACGIGRNAAAGCSQKRFVKVYLRNPDDLGYVACELDGTLTHPGDDVTYLRSDICREDLTVEIEVTVLGAE